MPPQRTRCATSLPIMRLSRNSRTSGRIRLTSIGAWDRVIRWTFSMAMAHSVYNDAPDALAVLTAKNSHVRARSAIGVNEATGIKGTFFTEEVCCVRIGHLRLRRQEDLARDGLRKLTDFIVHFRMDWRSVCRGNHYLTRQDNLQSASSSHGMNVGRTETTRWHE